MVKSIFRVSNTDMSDYFYFNSSGEELKRGRLYRAENTGADKEYVLTYESDSDFDYSIRVENASEIFDRDLMWIYYGDLRNKLLTRIFIDGDIVNLDIVDSVSYVWGCGE